MPAAWAARATLWACPFLLPVGSTMLPCCRGPIVCSPRACSSTRIFSQAGRWLPHLSFPAGSTDLCRCSASASALLQPDRRRGRNNLFIIAFFSFFYIVRRVATLCALQSLHDGQCCPVVHPKATKVPISSLSLLRFQ